MSFRYPDGWKIVPSRDRGTIVKISGETSRDVAGEISVSMVDTGGNLTVPAFEKILHDAMFARLKDLRKTTLEQVLTGRSGRLPAYRQTIKFFSSGMPVCQEYLFLPARGKIFTFVLTSAEWQRPQLNGIWRQTLESIGAPETLIAAGSGEIAGKVKEREYRDSYSRQCVKISCPPRSASLEQKILAVLPRPQEERFLEIPWQSNILQARKIATTQQKPIFLWIMDGNVLGAT
ncbi:MAG: hypothetical protein IPM23_05920 [Candidatus Melainabacteria bacterium]|nr:hypothetical protein [Candidatus Melainabacteria bacterium]